MSNIKELIVPLMQPHFAPQSSQIQPSYAGAKQTGLSRQNWRLQGKHLDLALLAGCSCLLTLVYHPVADALASHAAKAPLQASTSTSSSSTSQPGLTAPTLPTLPERKVDPKKDLEDQA